MDQELVFKTALSFDVEIIKELTEYTQDTTLKRVPSNSQLLNHEMYKDGKIALGEGNKPLTGTFDYSRLEPGLLLVNNKKEFFIKPNTVKQKRESGKMVRAVGSPTIGVTLNGRQRTKKDISNVAGQCSLQSYLPSSFLEACLERGGDEMFLEVSGYNMSGDKGQRIELRQVFKRVEKSQVSINEV